MQVQLKYLLNSQNTKLGRDREPEAVIQDKEWRQEEGNSPIKPPVTPRGREVKTSVDQRPQSKRRCRRNVRMGENSAQCSNISADTTSEWGEYSAQRLSVSADATSEWEALSLRAQRGAGAKKPQNTAPGAPGQELGNRELEKREAERGQMRSQTINTKLN